MIEDTVVGKTYKVKISDCCAEGYFTSKLIKKVEPATKYDGPEWHFENGVVLTMVLSKDAFEEVKETKE